MSSKKSGLWVAAVIFGILAIILYLTSIKEVDRETARYLGVSSVANIQGTVFAAACAILCGVNVVGATVIGAMEERPASSGLSSSSVASDVVMAIKKNEEEEKEKQKAAEAEKKKQEEVQKRIEEMKAKKDQSGSVEEIAFLEEISEETSMIVISEVWQKYNLAELHPDANQLIIKQSKTERMYGRLNNINRLKDDLKTMLLS